MSESIKKDLDISETPNQQTESEDATRDMDMESSSAATAEEPEITSEELRLKQQLIELNPLYLPHEFRSLPTSFDSKEYNFPSSYFGNTPRETRLLAYADNFYRQYASRFRDRTPLFLTPRNECDIRKFVCTTISPTKLPFPELHDALGAAAFVADFLDFAPLLPCTELPPRLLSPKTTLTLQLGTCFDYTTLLCSLLIGVGYNAYIVSGYATRECCYKDESRKQCPLLMEPPKKVEIYQEPPASKYQVKPMRDFISRYEIAMEVKQQSETRAELEKQAEEERAAREKAEEPKPDPLNGLRVHSWILILPGSRDVQEAFFIEPFTGERIPLGTTMYLGIESVWNHANYWVNMQDCTNGIGEMRYDLDDLDDWEFMLPSGLINSILMPNTDQLQNIFTTKIDASEALVNSNLGLDYGLQVIEDDVNGGLKKKEGEKSQADLLDTLLLVDLPITWTMPITLSNREYYMRYPNCQKETIYNRARMVRFSPYSQENGLVIRVTIYADRDLHEPVGEREYFEHRKDRLQQRIKDLKTTWVDEFFDHGRMTCQLRKHSYYSTNSGIDATRRMEFYEKMRTDGLMKRERTGNVMKEWYCDRRDRLIYRETRFGRTVKKFGPPLILKSPGSASGIGDQKITKKSYKEIDM